MSSRARAITLMLLMLLQSFACLVGVQIGQQRDLLAHALVHGQGLDHHHHDDLVDDGQHHTHGLTSDVSLHPDAFALADSSGLILSVPGEDGRDNEHVSLNGHQHFHDGLQVVGLPMTPSPDMVLPVSLAPPALLALVPPPIVLEGPLRPPRPAFA